MKYDIKQIGEEVVFAKVCQVSGDTYILKVPIDLVEKWQRGESIQNVFPMLTPDQREFMMTGITPAEWDHMFGPLEDK